MYTKVYHKTFLSFKIKKLKGGSIIIIIILKKEENAQEVQKDIIRKNNLYRKEPENYDLVTEFLKLNKNVILNSP